MAIEDKLTHDDPSAKPARRLRMEDLAAIAGVSKITVSRALRDSELVRPEVRERIKALAHEQGYRLNSMARNLRLMRTHSIALVIEMDPSLDRPMTDPVAMAALGGLLQELTSANYRVVLTTRKQIVSSTQQDVDGIILLGQGANDDATRQLRLFELPLAIWGAHDGEDDDGAVFVDSDNFAGGRLSGEYLRKLGRRRVIYLGDGAHSEVANRIAGLRAGLGDNASLTILPCAFTANSGRATLAGAIAGGAAFDAVVGCSDLVALGALEALQAAGLTAPDDAAVIGFDDIPLAASTPIPLTTIRQDWDAAGKLLAGKMLEWLSDGKPASARIPVQLVIRQSA